MILKTILKGNKSSPLFIIVLLCILSVSCNNSTQNQLDLLYGTTYTLTGNESEVRKTEIDIETFEIVRDSLKLQGSALYKVIAHPEYRTYIALTLDEKEMKKSFQPFTSFNFENYKGVVFNYQTPTKKSFQVIIIPSNLKESIDSKFTQQYIEKRFKNK